MTGDFVQNKDNMILCKTRLLDSRLLVEYGKWGFKVTFKNGEYVHLKGSQILGNDRIKKSNKFIVFYLFISYYKKYLGSVIGRRD